MTAGTSPDEPAGLIAPDAVGRRERAVASLALAEESPHPRLDRVTRLARMLFDVPISTVTLLDGPRAWYPSAQGIVVREVAREQTLCHAIPPDARSMVVPDASADPRFRELEWVKDGTIRFYAGRPLRDPHGNVLGAFCIVDSRARSFDAEQAAVLEEMAQLAEQELLASTDSEAISAIHLALQPSGGIRSGEWAIEGACVPALAVGGDFFDYFAGRDAMMVGLGDVMGKGTSAALLGATVRGTLRGSTGQILDGADLGRSFTAASRAMHDDLERAGSFVTVFGAVIDSRTGAMRYLDAGSGLCLVRRADGSTERLRGAGRPLGVLDDDEWHEQRAHLQPGDRLLLFSDGLLDLLEDQVSWSEPLGHLLASHDDPADLVATVRRLTSERTGLDDVTVLTVYRSPTA